MPRATSATNKDKNEEVRKLAHLLWEQEGRPEGCAEAHWLKAETMLSAQKPKATVKAGGRSRAKKA
jgi:hypothetical protein